MLGDSALPVFNYCTVDGLMLGYADPQHNKCCNNAYGYSSEKVPQVFGDGDASKVAAFTDNDNLHVACFLGDPRQHQRATETQLESSDIVTAWSIPRKFSIASIEHFRPTP